MTEENNEPLSSERPIAAAAAMVEAVADQALKMLEDLEHSRLWSILVSPVKPNP
jgi:hypothetical protein